MRRADTIYVLAHQRRWGRHLHLGNPPPLLALKRPQSSQAHASHSLPALACSKQNQKILLGPGIGDGNFTVTAVKSIHYKRMPVGQVVAGQTAAIALKKVKRSAVRKVSTD